MDQLRRDLGYAVRMILKHPGLAAVVILTFGIGIGLTTTIFALINGALYKGLPFPESDRIVAVGRTDPDRDARFLNVGVHDFVDWQEQQTVFEHLGALGIRTVNLAGSEGRPERYTGAFATANLFSLLRVQPVLGRGFREGEDRPGADPVIVIGYDIWQERYGGSADIIGRTVRANSVSRTIVGVAPAGFRFPDREQIWIPLELDPTTSERGDGPNYLALARIRDGVSLDQARAELATIARRLEQEYPETNEGFGAVVMRFTDLVAGPQLTGLLYTMLGAVIGVLLIACANVANLLLARASVRTREVAVRSALGASRRRVILQLMTEVLILSLVGGALGLIIGRLGIVWLDRMASIEPPPFWIVFDFDYRVLLFVAALVLLSSVISGFIPALRATRLNVSEALKDESRGSSSFRMGKFSGGLVIAEVALSCGLLILSGLMIKSVTRLNTQELPFTTRNIFTARLGLPQEEYTDPEGRIRFYDHLLPRLRAIPGVEAVTLSDGLPASGNGTRNIEVEGVSYANEDDIPFAREGIVTPGYFRTFESPVLQGRAFEETDRRESLPVAIVNETFVRTFFPEGAPLGRRFRMILEDTPQEWMTVVGVVPDMKMEGIGNLEGSPAGYYIPIAQSPVGTFVSVAIRTRRTPMSITPDVRAAVESLDANLPIYEVLSMDEVIKKQTWFYWLFGSLFMVFGFVALFLSAIGLYSVMSFSVTRRTQEMGIRMALGADSSKLLQLVMRQGVTQLGIGAAVGIGLAALVANPLQVILYNVNARDPGVFGVVVVTLACTGLLASFLPARRVTHLDPITALTPE